MAYFPSGMERPQPDLDDRGFWENIAERRLTFQRCVDCDTHRHPPAPMCARCGSSNVAWTAAPSQGRVYTFTVVHHPVHPEVVSACPYVVAVIEFPALRGVRIVSNLDEDPQSLQIGDAVSLYWDETDAGPLPRFRKSPSYP